MTETAKCPNCGATILKDAMLCGKCGMIGPFSEKKEK